jgi:hypothetical protein
LEQTQQKKTQELRRLEIFIDQECQKTRIKTWQWTGDWKESKPIKSRNLKFRGKRWSNWIKSRIANEKTQENKWIKEIGWNWDKVNKSDPNDEEENVRKWNEFSRENEVREIKRKEKNRENWIFSKKMQRKLSFNVDTRLALIPC